MAELFQIPGSSVINEDDFVVVVVVRFQQLNFTGLERVSPLRTFLDNIKRI